MDESAIGFESKLQGRLESNGFSSADPRYMAAVEIIIPFYGQYNYVASLIDNIFSTVNNNRYQITLVDDGSPNHGFIKELASKQIQGLVCHRRNENHGFGSAVNYAMQNRKNKWIPYICILHSDVKLVDANWLSKLGASLKIMKSKNIKMVSSRSSYFDDRMSHLSSVKSDNSDDYILNENEYLPNFCSLFHSELFSHVGQFKEFPLAGCESQEFAIRMRNKGFFQAVVGSSFVEHLGQKTTSQLSVKMKEILRNSRIAYDQELNLESPIVNTIV